MSGRVSVLLQVLGTAIGIAIVGVTVGIIGIALGAMQSLGTAIVLRSLFALAVLTVVMALVTASWRHLGTGALLGVALLGYLLNPLALSGRALFTQLVTPQPWVAVVVDLIAWLGLAALVIAVQVRRYPRRGHAQDPADEVDDDVADLLVR